MELTLLNLVLLLSRWYRLGRFGHCHIRQAQKEDKFVCVALALVVRLSLHLPLLCFVHCSGQPHNNSKSALLHCIFG